MKNLFIKSIILVVIGNFALLEAASNGHYMGVFMGVSKLNYGKSSTSAIEVPTDNIKVKANFKMLEYGYTFKDKYSIQLNYQILSQDDLYISNYTLGVHYSLYKLKRVDFHTGVYGGYSELTWVNTLFPTTKKELKSTSYVVGADLGIEFGITHQLWITLLYKYAHYGHETNLKIGQLNSTLKHQDSNSILAGFKFVF